MTWYRIRIHGDDLTAADQALRGHGITTREIVYGGSVGAGARSSKLASLSAIVEAEDIDDAETRTRAALGDEYELEASELSRSRSV